MGARNVVENARVELARYKAETSRMARCLKAEKLAIRRKEKEVRGIKRRYQQVVEFIKCIDELVDELAEELLVTVEAENNNNDLETANTWSEEAITEAVRGMNDLNLDGSYSTSSLDQAQRPCCSSNGCGRAADGNGYNEGCEGRNSGGFGGGEGHE